MKELKHTLMPNGCNLFGNALSDFKRDAYYLSTNILQEMDWVKRHTLRPLLTVSDLIMIDNIVDKIIKKYKQ